MDTGTVKIGLHHRGEIGIFIYSVIIIIKMQSRVCIYKTHRRKQLDSWWCTRGIYQRYFSAQYQVTPSEDNAQSEFERKKQLLTSFMFYEGSLKNCMKVKNSISFWLCHFSSQQYTAPEQLCFCIVWRSVTVSENRRYETHVVQRCKQNILIAQAWSAL